jgi:hypothetical protein
MNLHVLRRRALLLARIWLVEETVPEEERHIGEVLQLGDVTTRKPWKRDPLVHGPTCQQNGRRRVTARSLPHLPNFCSEIN